MSAVYENQASDYYCRGGKNYKSKLQCSPHLHYHIEFIQLLEGETIGYADTEETLIEPGDIFITFHFCSSSSSICLTFRPPP